LDQALSIRPKDRSLQLYELEYNKKFAIPAAGFFFSLLAFPLGLGTKRSGRTAGFGVALILSTLYWGLLFAGQTLGLRSEIAPGLAMWAPNALVLSMAALLWFLRKRGNRRIV
jgi:lipopolysaccharide export system permease protein